MFEKILIANRSEIAVRVIKTCRRLGIETVVVFSDADATSLAVEMANESVHIGASPASESYLVMDKIIEAVKKTGSQAVHPGFGFLSENPEFARRLQDENIGWIGPNEGAIQAMGDKISSKELAKNAGVSTIPGHMGLIVNTEEALRVSNQIGYPVMIKASAGGGGKGIRVAYNDSDVREGFSAVVAEAKAAFGDDRTFIEKFITSPRHIEIQVLGDKHGNCIHLFERECSIQRRNQKVIEEAPSSLLDKATRQEMGEQAIKLAKAVNYDSAGTVEFVASGRDKSFYFLEMNTRLQVEHPVTEMITGVDLVEQMIRSAHGEKLNIKQDNLSIEGWAVESRVYAEDPYRKFLPSIGRLKKFITPTEGALGEGQVRIDSGVREGDEISIFYDPMIAKLVTYGETRDVALDTQAIALDNFYVGGIRDNIAFCGAVIDQERFRLGDITTAYIADEFPEGFKGIEASEWQTKSMICVAAFINSFETRRASKISGRISEQTSLRKEWIVIIDKVHHKVSIDLEENVASISIGGQSPLKLVSEWVPGLVIFKGVLEGKSVALKIEKTKEGISVSHRGVSIDAIVCSPRAAELKIKLPERKEPDLTKLVISPMPGLMISVDVEVGQSVEEGQTVCVIEAMKMQNIIKAEANGSVKAVNVKAGESVAADEVMIEFA